MTSKAKIIEIFSSIQGEGPYVGFKQLFIRFCGCNLKCDYCDTNTLENINLPELSAEDLAKKVEKFDLKTIHSISLTGGEPLIWANYLAEFLPLIKKGFCGKIYLETNATLKDKFEKIRNYVDIISADIKLPSSSGVENSFAIHDEFFKITKNLNSDIFAKIVFDENILDNEIIHCTNLSKKYDIPLILQPKTVNEKCSVSTEKITEIFNKFLTVQPNTRVIPQVHKFLGVE